MTNDTRAAFEAWEKSRGGNLTRHDSGRYANSAMQGRWTVWQASRRAALEDAIKELAKLPRWKYTISHGDLYGYEDKGGDDISYDLVEEALRALADEGVKP